MYSSVVRDVVSGVLLGFAAETLSLKMVVVCRRERNGAIEAAAKLAFDSLNRIFGDSMSEDMKNTVTVLLWTTPPSCLFTVAMVYLIKGSPTLLSSALLTLFIYSVAVGIILTRQNERQPV